MISLNSFNSGSEYRWVGPLCSIACASSTDLVNSGSYFTELFVVIFGITTFDGLIGSFFKTCFTGGLNVTRDLGSFGFGFFGSTTGFSTGFGAGAGAAATGLATGFATGLATTLATGFAGFVGAGLATFLGAGFFATTFLAGFFAAGFLATAFLAGFAGFLGAVFFLLAISSGFF